MTAVEPTAGGHGVSFVYSSEGDLAAAYRMRRDDVVGELVPIDVNTTIARDRVIISHFTDDMGAEEPVDTATHTYCVQMVLVGIPEKDGDPPTVESEWGCTTPTAVP